MSDNRTQELSTWLRQECGIDGELRPLSGDASFRRYYRVGTVLAVDADPATQKNREYCELNERLHQAGIPTFAILRQDTGRGFFVIEDLGDDLLFGRWDDPGRMQLYRKAIALLPSVARLSTQGLPPFDHEFIMGELALFEEWLLEKTLHHQVTRQEGYILKHVFMVLAQNCADQPQVAMHRDYHSRNLLVRDDRIWVLDYQDMVRGPCLYDLASLLYDCYVRFEPEECRELQNFAFRVYADLGLLDNLSSENFIYQMRLTAMQRHIKVLGLFCRLASRDGKPGYLQHLPRVLDYVLDACDCDELFADFKEFLCAEVRGRLPT